MKAIEKRKYLRHASASGTALALAGVTLLYFGIDETPREVTVEQPRISEETQHPNDDSDDIHIYSRILLGMIAAGTIAAGVLDRFAQKQTLEIHSQEQKILPLSTEG